VQAQGTPPLPNNGGAEGASDIGKTANMGRMMDKQTGSLRFYGKVVMAGGKLPWDPIPVAVTCGEKTRYNTFTDPKGGFDIVAGSRNSEVVTTAHDTHRITPSDLIGCQVNAVLDGFIGNPLMIANRSFEDDPSLGTILLHRDEHAVGSVQSATTASAPPEALKEFDKARADDMGRHADSARKHLQKAVSLDPQMAEAWYHLGKLEESDKPQDALDAYKKAASADANFVPTYERIAAISANQQKWQDVVVATNHALKLVPAGTPQIWYFNAVGNLNAGDKAAAETSAETSLAMDPNHVAPNTEQLLAVILSSRGEYRKALDHLRHCLTYTPPGPNAELMKQQVAQLEKVVGQ
jgi:tetratricopeptide (TPR) repeat protein